MSYTIPPWDGKDKLPNGPFRWWFVLVPLVPLGLVGLVIFGMIQLDKSAAAAGANSNTGGLIAEGIQYGATAVVIGLLYGIWRVLKAVFGRKPKS